MRFARDFRGYSIEQLDAIIIAGGGLLKGKTRNELKDALDEAVIGGQIHDGMRRWRKPATVRGDDITKIAQVAARLLKLLNVENSGKPHVEPIIRIGLERQGKRWAHHWFQRHERERRVAVVARAAERKLIAAGRRNEAAKIRETRQQREDARRKVWDRWHQLHGGWPTGPSPDAVQTPEGTGYLVYGEDMALRAAVEGVQRLRTWAVRESRRLANRAPQTVQLEPGETPLRETRTIMVGRLARHYEPFFGRPFGVSKLALPTKSGKGGGSVGGPGVRFVQACLGPLGIHMKADAIEKAWDACRADSRRNMGNRTRK